MYKLKNKRLALIVIAIATCALVFGCVGFLTVQATPGDTKATETVKATPNEVETYTSSPSSTVSETEPTAPSTEAETEAETEPVTEKPTKKPTEAPTEKPTEKKKVETPKKEVDTSNIDISQRDLLARVIYLESGICSEYCQWLVGSTAMNLADDRGGLAAVAYDYNTFNVAYMIDSCTPSELSIKVAERILAGDRDYNVMAFRTDYYHGFGTPYTSVDNVYFSTY